MPDTEQELSTIKNAINKLLEKDQVDTDLLYSLTNKLASKDQDKVRFSIDAGIIDRLGQELVARQETAVSELVKNSYDADAQEVTLTFKDSDKIGGTLVISDDGDGMNRDELVNGFMKISSTSKIHNPISRKFKRKRAGQKGIGRFSVQRLGTQVTIITQVEHAESALQLKINWDDYVNDTNLLEISNSLKTVEKKSKKGTTLIIDGLRDKWTKAAIKRIYRYVSGIIQPFPLSKIQSEELDNQIDPGFKTTLFKKDNGQLVPVANESVMIYDHAAAVIEGHVDKDGKGFYTIDSDKLNINEIGDIGDSPDDSSAPFSELRNVRFIAYYFIYDPDLLPKMHSTGIQRTATKEGGIRLYRNGFRVLPYGESGDDWLDFDKSAQRRSLLFPHSNKNFFGFVELDDKDNLFNETSSREGLVNNKALRQLKNFVHRAVITGVLKVAHIRKTKISPSQKKDADGSWEDIEVRIKDIAHSLEELDRELDEDGGGVETKKRRRRKLKKIQKDIADLQSKQKSDQIKALQERSMLRVLSSVGLTVSQFIHEIKYYMDNIQSDIRYLSEELEGQKDATNRIEILDSNFKTFHTYTSYFSSVVSQNVSRELRPINIRATATQFLNSMETDANNSGIEIIEPQFNHLWLYTKPMHPSEWSSILFNFYTNSKKAIKRAKNSGKIFIECGKTENQIYLEFSDNGDGIPKDIEEFIFDEFFTTTSPEQLDNLDSNTEILGTGLGLKIVKDIVKSYRGSVYVASPKEDFSTCIRVEIPIATDKDEKKYGL